MATIRDVAEKAGVSTATVSRIINNKGQATPETIARVHAIIKELGYKPNVVAQSLTSKKSNTIALLVPTIKNPFFPELARGIEDVANSNGMNIFLCNTDDERVKLKNYLVSLQERYVDGIIINSLTLNNEDLDELHSNGIPSVTLDRSISTHNFSSITVKHREGAQLATKHLIDIGCRRIGMIRGPEDDITAVQRMWGYRDYVKDFDWFDQSWIALGDFSVQSGYYCMKELFQRHPDIDGVFASNDLMAIGLLKAAHEWGRKVPDELAIIGFDGIDMSQYTYPPLSTIKQPIYEMGKMAMEDLLRLIKDPKLDYNKRELDVELMLRESSMR
ncbi:LacI family DNA-binding transcriptional regulator [Metabacillus arenae]|uniref:LacI family DNA-binding transcriptional regulator n=1 Tax=Metabacillus arenae TaxID=2771434 RepID=A0A926RXL4_9BACI|nr:LacI family DNA-binding transcriptional regulator [Metabacillus arenae]MBD1382008.1 LacI family DNA-binding transcriptional regulator [Metabacillus arenae]